MKRLVELLDKVDEHPDFDPKKDYELVVSAGEMTVEERAAAGVERSVDDIELDLEIRARGHEVGVLLVLDVRQVLYDRDVS